MLICVFILVGVLLAYSPGITKPFLDKDRRPLTGSISEKIHVSINGVEQGMFIKGKDKTKPVLLFLHGGPGMPEYAVSREYPIVLEDNFVVCWTFGGILYWHASGGAGTGALQRLHCRGSDLKST